VKTSLLGSGVSTRTNRRRRARSRLAVGLLAGVITSVTGTVPVAAGMPAPGLSAASAQPVPDTAGHEAAAHGHHMGWQGTATEREDFVVKTAPTDNGLAVVVSQRDHGWAPQTVATIQPRGWDGELMGQSCVTGTGRFAVVVTGPRYAANRPVAMDRGGAAYSVDLRDGTVRPLLDGVTLYYHNPGCGATDRAVFTRYLGQDQQRTQVYEANLATGSARRVWDEPGQLTSAVPIEGGFAAVEGGSVLTRVGAGAPQRERTDGDPHQLRPNKAGKVDYNLFHRDGRPSEIRRLGEREPVASGPAGTLSLHAGRKGRTTVIGAEQVRPGADVTVMGSGGPDDTVSLDASAILRSKPSTPDSADTVFDVADGGTGATSGSVTITGQTAPASAITTDAPAPAGAIGASGREAAPPGAEANTTTPKCAVPRNNPDLQVRQPSPEQVWWAVNEASAGRLTTPRPGRAGYTTSTFTPSVDFPKPTLNGNSGKAVPPALAAAVFAQESALRQASTRALPGVPSEPLIANYYGDNGNLEIIDFDSPAADCGYGVAQLTTYMAKNSPMADGWTTQKQFAVAVDYQENVAAGIWMLGKKWNEAIDNGLKINDGDSDDPINWYFALWAYNSGIQLSSQTAIVITDGNNGDGLRPHGMGWTNNPRNANYPPDRKGFLSQRWEDSREPGKWPYPERVLGFVQNPRFDYTPWTCAPASGTGSGCGSVPMPDVNTFCRMDVNKCDPNYLDPNRVPGNDKSYCTRADRACWWYRSLPLTSEGTRFFGPNAASSEPAWPSHYEPNCALGGDKEELDPAPTAVLVDNLPGKQSLRCNNSGWSTSGTFSMVFGRNASGVELSKIDYHQLGTGWGGHTWFSKNRTSPSDTAHINTGTWTPPNLNGAFAVKVHIPDNGASTANAQYKVYASGSATTPAIVPVNQHNHRNMWITLGTFQLSAGARVVLDNLTGETQYTANVAWDAVAFEPATLSCSGAPGPDADGDHLPDAVESARGLNTNSGDTDGDGLPDAWEVDPSVPGAGIYLPGQPCAVTNRDALFGPYGKKAAINAMGELVDPDSRYNPPPDPRHKDVFLEYDWLTCNKENSGCPEIGIGPPDPFGDNVPIIHQFADAAYHLAPRLPIEDVINAFKNTSKVSSPDGRPGVTLHVLLDERTEHRPNCDQAPSSARGEFFGTADQRNNRAIIAAKSLAFRYVWSGHSTVDDRDVLCPFPTAKSFVFHDPVPAYDWTPYGSANKGGRDLLMSLSLAWWCPTNSDFTSPSQHLHAGSYSNACTNTWDLPGTDVGDGVYPAKFQVPRGALDEPADVRAVTYPKVRLLGVNEAEGTRQVWGRAFMRLLGVALGLEPNVAGNDPQTRPAPGGAALRAEDYGNWNNVVWAPSGDGTPVAAGSFLQPDSLNALEQDVDRDGVIEKSDNCPGVPNGGQANSDQDRFGDACDPDRDNDGLKDQLDPLEDIGWERVRAASPSSGREAATLDAAPDDSDNDGRNNNVDSDDDNDGVIDASDNCALVNSANRADADSDGRGDICDPDDDNDMVSDSKEQLAGSKWTVAGSRPEFLGAAQASGTQSCADGVDNDGDGTVDAGDKGCTDSDGDTMPDVGDNCPQRANVGWRDADENGKGDACDGVRIGRVRAAGVASYTSSGASTVQWTTAVTGVGSVRLNGTDCNTGTVVWSGLIGPRFDYGHERPSLVPVSTELPAASLLQGQNTVRVCVWDGGAQTWTDSATFVKDAVGVPNAGGGYHSMTPRTIVDSRFGVAFGSPWTPNLTRNVKVTGAGEVPAAGVSAVVLNVVAVNATAASDLMLKPVGGSTANWPKVQWASGQQLANSVTVPVGTNGEISLTNRAGNVDIVADVLGWFDDGSKAAPMTYTPLSPVRIVNSVDGTGGYASKWGPNMTRDVQIRGVGGVPADADSVVVAFTAGGVSSASALSIYGSGEPRPNVWTLYAQPSESRINLATARIGINGKVSIYNWLGNVDVFVDVVGYYRSDPVGSYLHPVTPARVLDTATGVGGASFGVGETRNVKVVGVMGIPATAKGVIVSLGVSQATAASFLQIFPTGEPRPATWDLTFGPARPVGNQTVLKVGQNGQVAITNWAGTVNVAVDVIGWY
jgi:hypothetical protein